MEKRLQGTARFMEIINEIRSHILCCFTYLFLNCELNVAECHILYAKGFPPLSNICSEGFYLQYNMPKYQWDGIGPF